jgi:hypothetical protein
MTQACDTSFSTIICGFGEQGLPVKHVISMFLFNFAGHRAISPKKWLMEVPQVAFECAIFQITPLRANNFKIQLELSL